MKKGNRIKQSIYFFCMKLKGNGGFGMNELMGIAAALILAAFIIIPGLKGFANGVMTKLNTWWGTDIMTKIFSTSGT